MQAAALFMTNSVFSALNRRPSHPSRSPSLHPLFLLVYVWQVVNFCFIFHTTFEVTLEWIDPRQTQRVVWLRRVCVCVCVSVKVLLWLWHIRDVIKTARATVAQHWRVHNPSMPCTFTASCICSLLICFRHMQQPNDGIACFGFCGRRKCFQSNDMRKICTWYSR